MLILHLHSTLIFPFRFLYGDQARFFNDEIYPDVKHSKMGTVAMASAGENLNASQVEEIAYCQLNSLFWKESVNMLTSKLLSSLRILSKKIGSPCSFILHYGMILTTLMRSIRYVGFFY